MKEDLWLIVFVFVTWGALASVYFTVPMVLMPHMGMVWAFGSVLFAGLAIVVALSLRKRPGAEDR